MVCSGNGRRDRDLACRRCPAVAITVLYGPREFPGRGGWLRRTIHGGGTPAWSEPYARLWGVSGVAGFLESFQPG